MRKSFSTVKTTIRMCMHCFSFVTWSYRSIGGARHAFTWQMNNTNWRKLNNSHVQLVTDVHDNARQKNPPVLRTPDEIIPTSSPFEWFTSASEIQQTSWNSIVLHRKQRTVFDSVLRYLIYQWKMRNLKLNVSQMFYSNNIMQDYLDGCWYITCSCGLSNPTF